MANNIRRIRQPEVDALAAAGAIRSVTVEPAPGEGWAVRIRAGVEDVIVASQDRPVRIWRSLDTLAGWMRARGIGRWEVVL